MKENDQLLPIVEAIKVSLKENPAFSSAQAVAFYAKPPTLKTDLDLLIVSETENQKTFGGVLQKLSNEYRLPIDTWTLTPTQLETRMKRIAGVSREQPKIFTTASNWDKFGFVPIVGEDYLRKTIEKCYAHPESGGPIPETPEEKHVFEPE